MHDTKCQFLTALMICGDDFSETCHSGYALDGYLLGWDFPISDYLDLMIESGYVIDSKDGLLISKKGWDYLIENSGYGSRI